MNVKPLSIEQDYQAETTRVWFSVDGEEYAIADNFDEGISLLDSEGYPIDDCNDHEGLKDALLPLYRRYADEYRGQDCRIDEDE